MYELQQAGEQSYYINSPAKIGIYRLNDTDIYLIDSGNDKEAAKKIIKIAEARSVPIFPGLKMWENSLSASKTTRFNGKVSFHPIKCTITFPTYLCFNFK